MAHAHIRGQRAAARRTVVAPVLASALALAGCGGTVTVEVKSLAGTSPLAEFLGTAPPDPRGLPRLDEREQRRQDALTERIAECMREAGFRYDAVPLAERIDPTLLAAYELTPAEFARQYGYGATTLDVEEYQDPNADLRAQLPPERREAYDRALWGEPPDGEGCHRRASAEVYGDPAEREAGHTEFAELAEEIDAVRRRVDADPRVEAAQRAWSDCLATAGYPGFRVPADARRSVYERVSAEAPPAGGPDASQGPTQDEQVLTEAREYELTLAPVDFECQRLHLAGPRREATLELEGAFLAEHREELARYRDWLAGS